MGDNTQIQIINLDDIVDSETIDCPHGSKGLTWQQKFDLLVEDYRHNIKQIKDLSEYKDLTLKPKTMEELKTEALNDISEQCRQILNRL